MENSKGAALIEVHQNGSAKNGAANGKSKDSSAVFETQLEKKDRWKSLNIVYFTLFLQSLGLAIAMTSIWPFLKKLDPNADKVFFSFVVGANPLGQFLLSPVLGYWTNKVPSIRIPVVTSIVMFCVSSGLYSSLDTIIEGVKYWMLFSRFLLGAASANVAVCRSYISAATTVDERTFALSMASLAQVAGFIVGPLLQALFTKLGEGVYILNAFSVSMYTAPGWVNVVLGVLNMIAFLPKFFTDHNIAIREEMSKQGKESVKEVMKSMKIDYLITCSLIFAYFIVTFNLVILESLGTPLSMDQFALTSEKTLFFNSILIGVGAFVACVIFCLLPFVCRKFKEIDVLVWGGLLIMSVGKFVYIPFGTELPQLTTGERNYTMENGTIGQYPLEHESLLGCPVTTQDWCAWTPKLGVPEFIIGYLMGVIGYPVGVTLIQAIFSKLLGARPQGTWMGVMVAAGSVARIIGPVIIVGGYTKFGTIWTFSVVTVAMLTPMIWLFILRNRILGVNPKEDEVLMTDVKTQPAKP